MMELLPKTTSKVQLHPKSTNPCGSASGWGLRMGEKNGKGRDAVEGGGREDKRERSWEGSGERVEIGGGWF